MVATRLARAGVRFGRMVGVAELRFTLGLPDAALNPFRLEAA